MTKAYQPFHSSFLQEYRIDAPVRHWMRVTISFWIALVLTKYFLIVVLIYRRRWTWTFGSFVWTGINRCSLWRCRWWWRWCCHALISLHWRVAIQWLKNGLNDWWYCVWLFNGVWLNCAFVLSRNVSHCFSRRRHFFNVIIRFLVGEFIVIFPFDYKFEMQLTIPDKMPQRVVCQYSTFFRFN